MPRKKKADAVPEMESAAEPKIPKELLDQLITGPIKQGEFETIFRALKKAVIERAMSAEMNQHRATSTASPSPLAKPINAMAPAARPSLPTMARWTSRCRAIEKAASSR